MEKIEYICASLSKSCKNKYENYVVNAIYNRVNNTNLEIETQKNIKTPDGKQKRIDMYLPQFKIAIEVDESYHFSDYQKEKDYNREKMIEQSSIRDSVGNLIKFRRIPVNGINLDELNTVINSVVEEIKEKISKKTDFQWIFGKEKIEKIKERGFISTDDTFDTNVEIINLVFNKNYKRYYRCTKGKVWCPVLSNYDEKIRDISDTSGWINYFNPQKDIIFEKTRDNDKQQKKKVESKNDFLYKSERYVFVKEINSFGKSQKRFAGIYIADGWDEDEEAERWKKISSELKIPIKE